MHRILGGARRSRRPSMVCFSVMKRGVSRRGLLDPPPPCSHEQASPLTVPVPRADIQGSNPNTRARAHSPVPMRQSRSISPSRNPPSRLRPSVGCRVSTTLGPRARACILSSTMCLSFW